MSLPENPNTLRETYYSVMAGQNDASILPDIETAPSTENRYLDYIARNGGGGGGDVSGVKGDAETTYRTGNVNITAANVGAYTKTETDTLLNSKADTTDVDNVKIASTATGSSITLTDSADGYVQNVTVKGKSRKTKNLLEITATTQTINGITFTVNNDGTIKVTGTAEAVAYIEINNLYNDRLIDDVTYVLSGCPKNGSNSSYRMDFGLTAFSDYGNGVKFTTADYTSSAHNARIVIFNGYACPTGGLIFKPMICTAADYALDPTFEPYFDGIKSIGDAGWGVVDLGTLTWTGPVSYTYVNRYSSENIANMYRLPDRTIAPRFVSRYRNRAADDPSGEYWMPGQITQFQDSPSIELLVPKDITTVDQLMQYIGNNNYVYYPLADATGATPILGITSKDGAGQGTAATITTGLPLRSVSDSIYDTLDNEKVIKKCAEVTPESDWSYMTSASVWKVSATDIVVPSTTQTLPVDIICNKNYTKTTWAELGGTDKTYSISPLGDIGIYDTDYDSSAIIDIYIVYPLATPTETPLTSTEKSALASLRTYDHTTYIDATDAPTMTVDYLLNTNNGKAVAGVDNKIIAIKSVSWTGTGLTSQSITFPEKPFMILGYTEGADYGTWVRGIMPFVFHPSTAMLRIFWKGVSETSHSVDYQYNSAYVLTINGNSISWTGVDSAQALNSNGVEYTIYYI